MYVYMLDVFVSMSIYVLAPWHSPVCVVGFIILHTHIHACMHKMQWRDIHTCAVVAGAGENPFPFVYLFKDGLIEEKC